MINEVYGLKPLNDRAVINGEAETLSLKTSTDIFVSKLQLGDKIEGILVKEENHIFLKLDNGMKLSINLLENVELGRLLSFTVMSKEGHQLVLKPHLLDTASHQKLTDRVINEFKLPNQAEMKYIIAQFMTKGLSLDKESLLSVFQNHRIYEVPTEALVNLKSNETPIEVKDLNQWARLKSEGIQVLLEGLQSIIAEMDASDPLERLLYNLVNKMHGGDLEKAIKESLLNPIEGIEKLDHSIIEKALKEWSLSNFIKGQLFEQIDKAINEKMKVSHIDFLRTLIDNLVKAKLEVDIKQINEVSEESKKIVSISRQLEELIDEFEKLPLTSEGKEKLQQVNQTFHLIQKYNIEAEYFYFPFILNEQQGNGELYFFKPHKKYGILNERVYLVMALDMPTLRKVEVHIEHIQNSIHMTLKVEQQSIKELIEAALESLYGELKDSGYEINQLRVSLLKATENEEKVIPKLHHMDLKI